MDEFYVKQAKREINFAMQELEKILNETRRDPIPEDVVKSIYKAIYFLDDALCTMDEGSDN